MNSTSRITRSLLLGLGALLLACTDSPTGPRTATVIVRLMTPATVASVTVEVSGPGLSPPVVVNIPVGADSTARDTLLLTAGSARRFVVTAVDTAGVQTHRADTTITLQAGVNAPLAMRLDELASQLGITVTFGGYRLTLADTSSRVLQLGGTDTLVATLVDPAGNSMPPDSIRWGTSNPAFVTVARGVVTAVRSSELATVDVVITASFRGTSARVRVAVQENAGIFPELGLLGEYNFDGNTADTKGLGADFTNSGGTFVADRNGRANSAIAFASLGATASRTWTDFPTDSFSVSMWLRVEGSFSYGGFYFFLWGAESLDPNSGLGVAIDENWFYRPCASPGNGYALIARAGNAGTALIDTSGCLNVATVSSWHHVVLTARNGEATVFVDGEVDATFTFGAPVATTNSIARLGVNGNSESATTRIIDNLAVWGRALSAEEVRAVFLSDR